MKLTLQQKPLLISINQVIKQLLIKKFIQTVMSALVNDMNMYLYD